MEKLVQKLSKNTFGKFPEVEAEVLDIIMKDLTDKKAVCRETVEALLECEEGWIFTNSAEYLDGASFDEKKENPKGRMADVTGVLVGVLRNRMDKYYYVVSKNLRDTIPKLIGNFLIKASQNDLQFVLFNSVCQSEEIVQKFSESKAIVSERDSLEKMIRVLRQAEKKLISDPNLATSAYSGDSTDIYDTICKKNSEFLTSIKSQHQNAKANEKRQESHLSANDNQRSDNFNPSPSRNDAHRSRQQSEMNQQGSYQPNVQNNRLAYGNQPSPHHNTNTNTNNSNSNSYLQGNVGNPNMSGFDQNQSRGFPQQNHQAPSKPQEDSRKPTRNNLFG